MIYYDILNKNKLNPEKKILIVFLLDTVLKKNAYSVTYQYIFNVMKILNQNFNLIIVSKNRGSRGIKSFIKQATFCDYAYLLFDKPQKYCNSSAKTMPLSNKLNYIRNSFDELEKNEPDLFNNLVGTVSSQFIIPGLNTNYEILPTNICEENRMNGALHAYQKKLTSHSLISHNSFLHQALGFPVEFMIHLMKKYPELWHYGFCHDTASAWVQWVPELNLMTNHVKCFYFEKDQRGTRDFIKFPMTGLQDFYGNSLPTPDDYQRILQNKPYDFIWGGTFPHNVDYRINAWDQFFDKLAVNATIRTQTNGNPMILPNKTNKLSAKAAKNPQFVSLIQKINASQFVKPTVPYDQYNKELKDYLFTLVLKCYYGKYDSLNFRVINSLYYGTIPLIDENYELGNLQIPNNFKKLLVVSSHSDIEKKVKYYRQNPAEYKKLFFQLFNYYIDSRYFNCSYYEKIFRTNYFAEIY